MSADLLTGREVISIGLWSSDIPRRVRLHVRCNFNSAVEQENGLDAVIDWGAAANLGSGDRAAAVRFDDGEVNEGVWTSSINTEATFVSDADAFISGMKGAKQLVVRIWRADRTTMTAQWDVGGFKDAVNPIEARCDPNYVPPPTPTPSKTPTPAPLTLWRYETGHRMIFSPVVADGIVYVAFAPRLVAADGSPYVEADSRNLDAVDVATGDLRWRYRTESTAESSPPVVADGVVYVYVGSSTDLYALYAVDAATGGLHWRYWIGGTVEFSLAAAADGVVYVYVVEVESDRYAGRIFVRHLYAVDVATGWSRWRYKTESTIEASPPVAAADGVVYVGSISGHLNALDADSNPPDQMWVYQTGGTISSLAAADGVVYVGSGGSHLYALDAASSELRWKYETEGPVESAPVVADGAVYVRSSRGHLYALDAASGKLRWRYRTGGGSAESTLVVEDGVVYAGSGGSYLNVYALDSATGNLLWRYRREGNDLTLPAVADGVVYFGSGDGYVYAVRVSEW